MYNTFGYVSIQISACNGEKIKKVKLRIDNIDNATKKISYLMNGVFPLHKDHLFH